MNLMRMLALHLKGVFTMEKKPTPNYRSHHKNVSVTRTQIARTAQQHPFDPREFGGIIDPEDFRTDAPSKNRINRQMDDLKLKKSLWKASQTRKELGPYKSMTFEELKRCKLISNTDGRPASTLTDPKWQIEFELRKLFLTPYRETIKLLSSKHDREYSRWHADGNGKYLGKTNWQEYCSYINDVLHTIRNHRVDYCYFIYQIEQLLKFHYDRLKTRYCDGYWEVWLEDDVTSPHGGN